MCLSVPKPVAVNTIQMLTKPSSNELVQLVQRLRHQNYNRKPPTARNTLIRWAQNNKTLIGSQLKTNMNGDTRRSRRLPIVRNRLKERLRTYRRKETSQKQNVSSRWQINRNVILRMRPRLQIVIVTVLVAVSPCRSSNLLTRHRNDELRNVQGQVGKQSSEGDLTRLDMTIQNTTAVGRRVEQDGTMTTTVKFIVGGKRRDVDEAMSQTCRTVTGREMNRGLVTDMLGMTDTDQDDPTSTDTDTKEPATLTTENTHGLRNERGRHRGVGLDHPRDTNVTSLDVIGRHRRHILSVVVSIHHRNAAIIATQARITPIDLAGKGLVRSLMPSAGLDRHPGVFFSKHCYIIVFMYLSALWLKFWRWCW